MKYVFCEITAAKERSSASGNPDRAMAAQLRNTTVRAPTWSFEATKKREDEGDERRRERLKEESQAFLTLFFCFKDDTM